VYCSTCGIRLENIVLPRNSRIPARSQSVENNTVPRRRISYLLIVIPIVLILGVLSIHIFYTNDEAATGGKTPRVTKQSEDEIDFIKVKKVIQNEGVSGKFSVYLKDLNSGKEYYTFNKNEPFIAAGLVFIPILIEVLDQAEAGYIDWNSRVRIYEQMLVGGTGLLNQKDVGSSYSIDGLTTLMMRYSDNSCANILIDRVGGLQQINGKMESLGLSNTRLNRRLMDTYAMNQGIENYTSAKDMGRLLEIIVNKNLHELLSKPEKDGMELYLPESCTIYHQIGVLSHTYNDVGIIHGPSSDFILVILSNGVSNDVSKRVIGKIVQTVYEDLER
jgi:beta-lactamase class A